MTARIQKGKLPCDEPVDQLLLLLRGPGEIDAGGFYAFVAHQIRQEGDIVKTFQKIFGKAVAERMGIDHRRIQPVDSCGVFQLGPYAAGSDGKTVLIEKERTFLDPKGIQPLKSSLLKLFWNIDPPAFSPLWRSGPYSLSPRLPPVFSEARRHALLWRPYSGR